jgi:hypothetical protein
LPLYSHCIHMRRLRVATLPSMPKQSSWQKQNRLDQRKYRTDTDTDQAQRYRDQPDNRPEYKCQQCYRPAQDKQDQPTYQ